MTESGDPRPSGGAGCWCLRRSEQGLFEKRPRGELARRRGALIPYALGELMNCLEHFYNGHHRISVSLSKSK